MENVNYSLDQITGILTQQLQLLRNMKESNDTYSQSVPFFSTSFNPFSSAQNTANPFRTGLANATGATSGQHVMNAFGLPTAAQLGIGLGVNMFQRKVMGTDVSTIGTVPATSGFGFFQNASKINYEERMMAAAHMGDKLSTGALNLAGTALSVFGGWPGMIAGAGFTLAADQVKQQNAYNKYLLQNSYRFINYGESTNTRGMGGFGLNERMDAANFLRRFGTENLISDADTQRLLKSFIEGDLLRNTKDLKSFKENMTKLTKAVKEGALALGETYESMVGMMSEMKKLGMDPTRVNSYAAGAKAVQGMTGLNGSNVMSNLMGFVGSMAQGTGMTASNLYANAQGALIYTNSMYDSLYEKAMAGDQSAQRNLNLISNLGGVEGAYQSILGAEQQVLQSGVANSQFIGVLYHDWNENTHTWEFNQSKFDDMIKNAGSKNLTVEAQKAMLGYDNIAKSAWLEQGAELTMGNLDSYEMIQYLSTTLNSIKQNNSVYRNKNMNTKDMLRMFFGMSSSQAELLGEYIDNGIADGGATLRQHESLTNAQEAIDTANANAKGLGYSISNWWSGVKDTTGDIFSPFAEFGSKIGMGWQDIWNGYQYRLPDIQSKHGATSVEESAKIVDNALESLSKSLAKFGDKTGEEKKKIDALRTSMQAAKDLDAPESFSNLYTDRMYEISKKSWGILGHISNKERQTYNDVLRQYLGADNSVSDTRLVIDAAQKVDSLVAKGVNNLSSEEKQFIASFGMAYQGRATERSLAVVTALANNFDNDTKNNNIKNTHYSAQDLRFKASTMRGDEYTEGYYNGTTIKEYDRLIKKAISSGNFEEATKLEGERAELEAQIRNYEIAADETETSINQHNLFLDTFGKSLGWSDDRIKANKLGAPEWHIFSKQADEFDPVEAEEQRKKIAGELLIDAKAYIDRGSFESSSLAKEMAAAGIDISDFEKGIGDQERSLQMIDQLISAKINGISTTATDDLGETSKDFSKNMDKLNDIMPKFADSMNDAAIAAGNFSTYVNKTNK